METQRIIDSVKKSFCSLTHFKNRANALEIITAFSTLNNKFVSVFITYSKNKFVVTDYGWIDQNYYETPLFDENEMFINRITSSFALSYNVKSVIDRTGVEYYYKACEKIEDIPNLVFDLANFIVGTVNSFCIQYKDEKEEKERETFKTDANVFLKVNYNDLVRLRAPLDDFKNIKFNAIVTKSSELYLITYVTGSTQNYFENDLRKSIVNFEIASKSKYRTYVKEKITIINNESDGYHPTKSASIFELLNEKTTREPILWSERGAILEVI